MVKRIIFYLVLVLFFGIGTGTYGNPVTLICDPNTEPDLAGYMIYYGSASGSYNKSLDTGLQLHSGFLTLGLENDLTYYIAATAYNTGGLESGFSNEIVYTPPNPNYSSGFETQSEINGWDSNVNYVVGNSTIEWSNEAFSSGTHSMKVYGGRYQSARRTIYGLVQGQTVTFTVIAMRIGTSRISVRLNGLGQTNWTQSNFNPPSGFWQSFSVSKVVTNLDTHGLDINIFVAEAGAILYVDDISFRPNFTITASATSGGNISPSGVVTKNQGENQTFTFSSNSACYRFDSALIDDVTVVNNASYSFSNIRDSHRIRASFSLITYTINASAGANGTISPTGETAVNCGENETYTILPDEGIRIIDVVVDGVSQGAIDSYTFSGVIGNHTIYATFQVYSDSDFESESDIANWDSNVNYVVGNSTIEWSSEASSSGTHSMKVYGGRYQSARKTFYGFTEGQVVVFTAKAMRIGSGRISARLNGTNQTDWTQFNLDPPNGVWQEFFLTKTITSLDKQGLDANIFVADPGAILYVDDIEVSQVLYATNFVAINDWDNQVAYAARGGAVLSKNTYVYYSGRESLQVSGGTYQAARHIISSGLVEGRVVTFSGWVLKSPVGIKNISVRLNGTGQNDWTQIDLIPTGDWQYFEISKTLTALDILGLDINVFTIEEGVTLFLDKIIVDPY